MIIPVFKKIKNQSSKHSKAHQHLGKELSKIVAISFFALFISLSLTSKASAIEEISYKVIENVSNNAKIDKSNN